MRSVSTMNCPRCGKIMDKAFANASAMIPYETPETILQFIHTSGSVQEVPLWKRLLPHPAEYLLTYLCENCCIYVIDFSRSFSSSEAKVLAKEYLQGEK